MGTLISNDNYKNWLFELKSTIQKSQIKAAVAVNSALIQLYWELGKEIVEKQKNANWGTGFINQLSNDLKAEFPEMGGFSKRNLEFIRQWYLFYSFKNVIAKQPVSQLPETENSIWQQPVAELEKILFSVP